MEVLLIHHRVPVHVVICRRSNAKVLAVCDDQCRRHSGRISTLRQVGSIADA